VIIGLVEKYGNENLSHHIYQINVVMYDEMKKLDKLLQKLDHEMIISVIMKGNIFYLMVLRFGI
jgi:hypothetical protein